MFCFCDALFRLHCLLRQPHAPAFCPAWSSSCYSTGFIWAVPVNWRYQMFFFSWAAPVYWSCRWQRKQTYIEPKCIEWTWSMCCFDGRFGECVGCRYSRRKDASNNFPSTQTHSKITCVCFFLLWWLFTLWTTIVTQSLQLRAVTRRWRRTANARTQNQKVHDCC